MAQPSPPSPPGQPSPPGPPKANARRPTNTFWPGPPWKTIWRRGPPGGATRWTRLKAGGRTIWNGRRLGLEMLPPMTTRWPRL